MNRFILSVALLFASSTLVLAQSNTEQSVRQTLDKVQAALRSNDADAYAPLLADDYTLDNGQGITMNKTQRLESMKSGQIKYESFAFEDVKVRLNEDTAVVNAKVNMKMSGAGASTNTLVSLTFVKKGDLWLLAAVRPTPSAK